MSKKGRKKSNKKKQIRKADKVRGRSQRATGRSKHEKKLPTVTGTLAMAGRGGFGFVVPEGREDKAGDIFVAARDLNGAMDGDLVQVGIYPGRSGYGERHSQDHEEKGPEGKVLKVLRRGRTSLVGRLDMAEGDGFGYVVPIDAKAGFEVYVAQAGLDGAKTEAGPVAAGDIVEVKITSWPSERRSAEGVLTRIIAEKDDPHAEIYGLLAAHDVPVDFPPEALALSDALAKNGIREKDLRGREDLREQIIYTIDGADSKDFDDAVSCELLENGHYLLGVHIADVSHYVTFADPLDKSARARANSHYLLDLVVPMLPAALSDDLCSLVPHEDRLTLSCEMEVDEKGRVVKSRIFNSVICSKARLTYDNVSEVLESAMPAMAEKASSADAAAKAAIGNTAPRLMGRTKDGAEIEAPQEVLDSLLRLADLTKILVAAATERGAIDFDLPEAAFTMDESGYPVEVHLRERRLAHRMIEQCMILANETVAKTFAVGASPLVDSDNLLAGAGRKKAQKNEVPFLYRIHERPEMDKMEDFLKFAAAFGLPSGLDPGKVQPRDLQAMLAAAEKLPTAMSLRRMMLRAMQKAAYDPACKGHYGLALQYYTHFTSPIRRYSDLFIHREIKGWLAAAGKNAAVGKEENAEAPAPAAASTATPALEGRSSASTATPDLAAKVAAEVSAIERDSIDLERQVEKMAMAKYMQQHVGEVFEGTITGLTGSLLFVGLANTIEGAVRLADIEDDYYVQDEENYCVVGLDHGKKYRLGDAVKVRAVAVDEITWDIDFVLLCRA